jgi:hypothetical protein
LDLRVLFASTELSSAIFVSPTELQYFGRHLVNSSLARFDWVGTGAEVSIRGKRSAGNATVVVDMDTGTTHRIAVLLNKTVVHSFVTKAGRKNYTLWTGPLLEGEEATVRLMKATEGDMKTVVSLFGMELDGAVPNTATSPQLRLDVYGDSDSAAFGVDGNEAAHPIDCALCEGTVGCYENFPHGWV